MLRNLSQEALFRQLYPLLGILNSPGNTVFEEEKNKKQVDPDSNDVTFEHKPNSDVE